MIGNLHNLENTQTKDTPTMHNIMLDLETMGTGPNAAVIAIGACLFDVEARAIGPNFYRALDLEDVIRGGGEMDASTVMWWLKQPDEARRPIYDAFQPFTAGMALAQFANWIEESTSETPFMWGNGANFDTVILRSMYRRMNINPPWDWWNDRCYRTIMAHYPESRKLNVERIGPKHHALHDAVHQARMLIELLNPETGIPRQLGQELDDDDPLWLVNAQIEGLLDGEGASEDHESVLAFLLKTGLPRSTVDRLKSLLHDGPDTAWNAAISAAADRCEAICHQHMRSGNERAEEAADECKDAVRRLRRETESPEAEG